MAARTAARADVFRAGLSWAGARTPLAEPTAVQPHGPGTRKRPGPFCFWHVLACGHPTKLACAVRHLDGSMARRAPAGVLAFGVGLPCQPLFGATEPLEKFMNSKMSAARTPLTIKASKARNPLVAPSLFRQAGAHRSGPRAERQQAARSLKREIADLSAPPP